MRSHEGILNACCHPGKVIDVYHIYGLVQERRNSSALAMDLRLSFLH